MTLTIENGKPGKAPLVFDIRNVTLHDVGDKKPFQFEAWLVNAKPVGDIHSTGQFGPWQDDAPRDTPVDGEYSFTNADLGTIKGIAGTLSSTGRYGGTLGEIGVTGDDGDAGLFAGRERASGGPADGVRCDGGWDDGGHAAESSPCDAAEYGAGCERNGAASERRGWG